MVTNICGIIADNLLAAYRGNNWTDVSITDALKDITYKEAGTKTAASVNTIAALMHHLKYWNMVIIERISGNDPLIPDENGFDHHPPESEEQWQELILSAGRSFDELASVIRELPETKFSQPTNHGRATILENIFGIVEHTYYHLGQITMIKRLTKLS